MRLQSLNTVSVGASKSGPVVGLLGSTVGDKGLLGLLCLMESLVFTCTLQDIYGSLGGLPG